MGAINLLNQAAALDDLAAVVGGRPDGLMLPKADGPRDVERRGHYLDALEAREGVAKDSVRILAVATETAAAPFRLGAYADIKLPRLAALTWGAEDLSAAIGAATNKGADGDWDAPYQLVRSACLLAAHAAAVQAIDTLYSDFKNAEGLRASCAQARRQGFTGRVAINPDQLEFINETFSPSAAELAHTRRVIAAFEASPDVGTVGLDGEMLDTPHLVRARRIVAAHDNQQGKARA